MKTVVGLGNPGADYDGTRHNVGHDAVDALGRRFDARWENRGLSEQANISIDGTEVLLLKPMTYMNNSGRALRGLTVDAEDIIVVHDDVDLPLGSVRISYDRGSAGHHGVESVVQALGTKKITRVRIGVEKDKVDTTRVHVLKKFSKKEKSLVGEALEKTTDAIITLIKEGRGKAMNTFN